MRRQPIVLVCALALFARLPQAVAAQEAQLGGTWSLNLQASDDLSVKINEVVAPMNVLVRPIARRRLRSTNQADPRLVISYDSNIVRIDLQGGPSVSSSVNGQRVLWDRETGRACPRVRDDCVSVTTEWENGRLEQTFVAEDGQRVNVLSVSPDGNTLTLNVTVTSPRLPQPLRYKLVYNRAS